MSTYTVVIIIFILICISAFFSSSETAMIALNKYKLKHLAKKKSSCRKEKLIFSTQPREITSCYSYW